jgi:hypothetical protein
LEVRGKKDEREKLMAESSKQQRVKARRIRTTDYGIREDRWKREDRFARAIDDGRWEAGNQRSASAEKIC